MTATKVDSNLTGLSYAVETSLGTLAGASDIWVQVDPNSYSNFGAQLTLTPRIPINPSRMRRKGIITDLAADAGFQMDLTKSTARDLLPGFFFAPFSDKYTLMPTAVASPSTYTVASGGSTFTARDIVFAAGFANMANNGLKRVASSTATTVVVTDTALVTETVSANYNTPDNLANGGKAYIRRVGIEGATGDIGITNTAGVTKITSTVFDFTTLNLKVGEWLFVGGDTAIMQFATAADNGFARIQAVTTNAITVDKTAATWVTDAGAAKTIRLWFGSFISNQKLPGNQIRTTYTWERSMSTGGWQYVEGCVASQFTITMNAASKVTCELMFMGITTEQVPFGTGAKLGQRPNSTSSQALNTTSDFSRLAVANKVFGTNGSALTNFLRDLTLVINNSATPTKALSRLGAIDITVGDFNVSGQMTAYFTDVATIDAVRTNSDVTLDFALVNRNSGMLFDVPLLALGNGRANVVKDQPIELPLSHDAGWDGTFDYVLSCTAFDYLPSLAD